MILNKYIIVNEIYAKIFLKEIDYSINIFLCGSDPNNKKSIRNVIYNEIKNDSKFNIVFPEWLFSDLLAKKDYNLLKLEHALANDVDAIVLPLEGFGTFAELGAFATFDKLIDKLLIVNERKYKDRKSFINIGPIKLVVKSNRQNIIYYQKNELNEMKKNVMRRMKSLRSKESKFDIKNIFNLSRFILYLIALFQPVQKNEIIELLKHLGKTIPIEFIDPCFGILFQKMRIEKDPRQDKSYYVLSELGHYYIYEDLLPNLHIIRIFSKIRTQILNYQNRKLNKLNLGVEIENF